MLKAFLSAALVAMMLAGPAHARGERFEPPPSGVFEFVGFSTGTVNGGVGMLGMHSTCQVDFGPDSSMCTSEEYWRSPSAADPGLTPAWIHPIRLDVNKDFSLIGGASSCQGWTKNDGGSFGSAVVENGGRLGQVCDNARPVTCCARLN